MLAASGSSCQMGQNRVAASQMIKKLPGSMMLAWLLVCFQEKRGELLCAQGRSKDVVIRQSLPSHGEDAWRHLTAACAAKGRN